MYIFNIFFLFFYVSCGLAVLAMAARPLFTGDSLLYGSTNSAGDAVNGQEDVTINEEAVHNAHLQAKSNKVFPLDFEVPTLEDYQNEAVKAGYSNQGEMFSARVMDQIANHFQPTQHDIKLVKEDLMAAQTPPQSPTKKRNNSSPITISDDSNQSSETDKETKKPAKLPTSFRGLINGTENPENPTHEIPTNRFLVEYVSNERSNSPYKWKLETCLPLAAHMYTPIKIVQRLMRGDLVAVW